MATNIKSWKLRPFYTSNKNRGIKGIATIVTLQECNDDKLIRFETLENVDEDSATTNQTSANSQAESDVLWKEYKYLKNRLVEDLKAYKLTHPRYGILHLVNNTRDASDSKRKIGLITNMPEMERCLKVSKMVCSEESTGDEVECIVKCIREKFHVMNDEHLDESVEAMDKLPSLGIVTVIVAFEEYLHNLLDAAFTLVYDKENITSIDEFEKTFKNNITRSETTSSNVIQLWLRDDNNIKGEFKEKLKDCPLMVEYDDLIKRMPESFQRTLNNNKQLPHYKAEKMYESMRTSPNLSAFLAEILKQHREKTIETQLTQPTLEKIATTFGKLIDLIADKNQECGKKMFRKILDEIVQNYTEYYPVLREHSIEFQGTCYRKFSFRLEYENILDKLSSEESDDPSDDLCIKLKLMGEWYYYPLSADDQQRIKDIYMYRDGWRARLPNGQMYLVKPKNIGSFEKLMKLFYGLRCIFAHGNAERTLSKGGALSERPDNLELIAIKVTTKDSAHDNTIINRFFPPAEAQKVAESFKQYFLNVWDQAAKKSKDPLNVNYDLLENIQNFHLYAANIIGKTVACCIWDLLKLNQQKIATFDMITDDLERMSLDLGYTRGKLENLANFNRYPMCKYSDKCTEGLYCTMEHTEKEEELFKGRRFNHKLKTKLCRHFEKGHCRLADNCDFSHDLSKYS